jgi:hypothetical protein
MSPVCRKCGNRFDSNRSYHPLLLELLLGAPRPRPLVRRLDTSGRATAAQLNPGGRPAAAA